MQPVRKLVLLALGIGAAVLVQRRASKMGLIPAALLTLAAEKGLSYLQAQEAAPPPPKPSLFERVFGPKVPLSPPKGA